MRIQKTYSFNHEVMEEFDREVQGQTRSRLIEALIVNFLVEYTGDKSPVKSPNLSGKEIHIG